MVVCNPNIHSVPLKITNKATRHTVFPIFPPMLLPSASSIYLNKQVRIQSTEDVGGQKEMFDLSEECKNT